jgi:hypothetical protein
VDQGGIDGGAERVYPAIDARIDGLPEFDANGGVAVGREVRYRDVGSGCVHRFQYTSPFRIAEIYLIMKPGLPFFGSFYDIAYPLGDSGVQTP